MDIDQLKAQTQRSLHRSRLILLTLFGLGLAISAMLYCSAPELSPADREILYSFPSTPPRMAATISVVEKYAQEKPQFVRASLAFVYVFLQAFAIPGPLLLSIMAGALFGAVQGFFLVCICATSGACLCYLLSATIGKGLVLRWFPEMLLKFHVKIQEHKHNLFWYMLFLRITPICPNWFINLASPLVGIPLKTFALATFLGLMPANVIHVSVGETIASVKSLYAIELHHVVILLGLGGLALLPTLCTKKIEKLA